MLVQELLNEISSKLSEHDSPLEKHQKSLWILEKITGKNQSEILVQDNIELTEEQKQKLEEIINKHVKEHMPLQYIIGSIPFLDLEIFVEPPILIPRPETEYWCWELINKLNNLQNKNISILDIGTGTGCIAISLAKAFPESNVFAVDISAKALDLAQKNVKHNNIENVTLIESDLFQNLSGKTFDLIVSNPPYICEAEFEQLDLSVKNWEDYKALVCRDNGLEIIKRIIQQAPDYIKYNKDIIKNDIPNLVLEIGYLQGKDVSQFMKENKFINVELMKDLAGKDRVVSGIFKSL